MGTGEATTLRALLAHSGPLSPTRALAIVRQIAAELDLAHAESVAVRDVVDPAKIMLSGADLAYLTDSGVTPAGLESIATGTDITGLAYVAPERLTHNAPISAGTDVYALACVLFECLTGSPPYPAGDDLAALIAAHQGAAIPQASRLRASLPAGLDDVIARGLAKDPANRYSSAGALADAAQQALTTPAAGVEPARDPAAGVVSGEQLWFGTSPPAAPAQTGAGALSGTLTITSGVLALLLGGYHGWNTIRLWRSATWCGENLEPLLPWDRPVCRPLFAETALSGIAALLLILGAAMLLGRKPIGRWCILTGCMVTVGYAGLSSAIATTVTDWLTEIGATDDVAPVVLGHRGPSSLIVLSLVALVIAVLVVLPSRRSHSG